MSKQAVVKFRTTQLQKQRLADTASRHGLTVSSLLRRTMAYVANGLPPDGGIRADMASVRRMANLCALAEASLSDQEAATRLRQAVATLQRIAERHLGPSP
jgi:antitoxin component of RelBE/YafQ-DinJ toxin-antitoxin module